MKIYIIHGWTYSTTKWQPFVDDLRRRGFEPVMLAVPGLTEPSEKVWTLDEYVTWLDQKITGNAILLGHSNGGRIAIAYGARYPEKIEKLILIDSAGIVHTEWWLVGKRKVSGALAKAGKTVTSSPKIRKLFYRIIGARDYERASEPMRQTMKNLITVDLTDRLGKISCPTLLVWGAKDTATPVSDAYLMRDGIAHSQLVVIPDAGHSPQISHFALVAEKIQPFLKPLANSGTV